MYVRRGTIEARHRRILIDAHAVLQHHAANATHELAGMHCCRRRIVNAGEEGAAAGHGGNLFAAYGAEWVDFMRVERRHDIVPGAHLARAGGAPDPAVAAELGIDAMHLAEGRNLVGRSAEGIPQRNGPGRAAESLQGTKLGPLREDHAGVAPAGTAAADIGLDDGDIQRGLAAFQFEGRPHSGEPAADNTDIRGLAALKRRTVFFIARDRFAQPDAAPLDPRLHRISRRPPTRRRGPGWRRPVVPPPASSDRTAPSPARWWNGAGRF